MRALLAALAGAALVLTGCASSGSGAPNWKPKPSFSGEGYEPPANPQPVQPATPNGPSPSPSPGNKKIGDGAVVATHLTAPTGIAILPDNTALVGERTTGRIVRVQPQPGRPVRTVRTIHGLSTRGGGGLLDLAISPNYREDNLIFAYITTRKDNRVVTFTLTGPVTPVLTGIPRGRTGNTGRIAFAADGSMLVGTGNAGHPSVAFKPSSLAGKVLRITDIGRPAQGNPVKGSRVYASGFGHTDGLCATADSTLAFQTESVPSAAADPIFRLLPGRTFALAGADEGPVAMLPSSARSPGGCAVLGNTLFTTSLDGKELLAAPIGTTSHGAVHLGKFSVALHDRYGRLRTVVGALDGALWLSTSNKDGKGHPVPTDERILRIIPSGGGGNSPL
ncbi:MAG TPA: PQQ-dependent sugar dehydrogenase [Jatrophihabitans sp.]|jgi:glucose/arabinose dehydrogenase